MDPIQAEVVSVSTLSKLIEQTLSLMPGGIRVRGEVQKVRIFKDFWIFFDLVDEDSSLSCMCSLKTSEGVVPVEGGNLEVSVQVSLGKRSDIRLKVLSLKDLDSPGVRLKQLEELKLKLAKEGIFSDSNKKELPKYPQKVALITARNSSACEDFKKISSSRWPNAKLKIFNVAVQGKFAEPEIIAAIQEANHADFDLIALVRGGGSRDDLAVFNQEALVRAVAESQLPIVAGIGHEDDISLADLAADVRASTPSNAAELIFPDAAELAKEVRALSASLSLALNQRVANLGYRLSASELSLSYNFQEKIKDLKSRLDLYTKELDSISVVDILKRGFASLSLNGKSIKSMKGIKEGDLLEARLVDGKLKLKVEGIETNIL